MCRQPPGTWVSRGRGLQTLQSWPRYCSVTSGLCRLSSLPGGWWAECSEWTRMTYLDSSMHKYCLIFCQSWLWWCWWLFHVHMTALMRILHIHELSFGFWELNWYWQMWAISIASFCCRLCVEMLTGQQPRNYWAEILAHLVPVTRAVTLSMRSNDGPLKCYRGDLSNIPASDVGSYVNNDINSSHQHYHNCRAPIVRISVWQLIIRDEYFDRIPSPTCWSGPHNIQHHGLTWMGTGD